MSIVSSDPFRILPSEFSALFSTATAARGEALLRATAATCNAEMHSKIRREIQIDFRRQKPREATPFTRLRLFAFGLGMFASDRGADPSATRCHDPSPSLCDLGLPDGTGVDICDISPVAVLISVVCSSTLEG